MSRVGYIDVRTDQFVDKSGDLELNDPHAIIETLDGKHILVGNRAANEILVQDSESFELIRSIDLGHPVDLIDLHPNGRFAYAALRFHGVAGIDLKSWEVSTTELGGDPHGLLVRPAAARR